MYVEFPRKLWEADHDWNIVGSVMSSGVTTAGAVDVRSDGGGFWSASLNNIRFIDRTYTLLWRAVRQLATAQPIIVHRRDTTWSPFPNGTTEYGTIPHSDDALFSDGSDYYQPVIDVETYADASLRDTTLYLKLNNCDALVGGESFSINHDTWSWRLYEIATVEYIDETHVQVTFNPPLREAVPSGTLVEFDRPRCVMKLVNSAAMDFNATTYPFSLATAKFIETKFA
jgi:hypothetical protein